MHLYLSSLKGTTTPPYKMMHAPLPFPNQKLPDTTSKYYILVLGAISLGDGLLRMERHNYTQLPALSTQCATHTLSCDILMWCLAISGWGKVREQA